jgi:nicotinate-nucleotide adenylyltransferase
MRRLAFYGGTFDPPHRGHFAIAEALLKEFDLDQFIFLPAFHAPHKTRTKPTSAYDRFAMLCLMTGAAENMSVSKLEIDLPEKPYTIETLPRLKALYPDDRIFLVMGADSWRDILTWREWEKVLLMTDHIVVTRPGVGITTDHISEKVRERIVAKKSSSPTWAGPNIFFSDAVNIDVSATDIRKRIKDGDASWKTDVPPPVANYIEKYQIYT